MNDFEELSLLESLNYQEYDTVKKLKLLTKLRAMDNFLRAEYLRQFIDYNNDLLEIYGKELEEDIYYWNSSLVLEQAVFVKNSVRNKALSDELQDEVENAFAKLNV